MDLRRSSFLRYFFCENNRFQFSNYSKSNKLVLLTTEAKQW